MQPDGPGTGWERGFWFVFRRSANPMALVDEDRRFVEVNDATLAVWQRNREEVIGARVTDFIPASDREAPKRGGVPLSRPSPAPLHGTATAIRGNQSTVDFEYAARMVQVGGRRVAVYVMLSASEGAVPAGEGVTAEHAITEREREVVTAIAMGHQTRQIADELHISPETVRTHVRNAMSKLGTHTRAQLVARVISDGGLLDLPNLKE